MSHIMLAKQNKLLLISHPSFIQIEPKLSLDYFLVNIPHIFALIRSIFDNILVAVKIKTADSR
jgi:hypothetical protein